ncbi:MAG TPA: glycosyltransferase [Ignavibacteria bacterium]|nr:glycosyltransferase [Ignavibacteria bacterium]HMR39830.1 glycosyltransferase [Ignavibacteria bacterium]
MMGKIKNVTVLMAVYNDSGFVKGSIKSILNQTHRDFEFIIINDGSDDNGKTGELIKSFKDQRIIYKKIPHKGLAGALNYGLGISSFDHIARIDADDLNTKDRLEKQIAFLNSDKGAGVDISASWSVYFDSADRIIFLHKPPSTDPAIKKFLDLHNPLNHSSVIFRKDRIMASGGYNENFGSYEDFELWFRLRDKVKFHIDKEVLVYNRLRPGSIMDKGSTRNIYDLLFKNAERNMGYSKTASDKKYWMNILFWIEYFYGNKAKARKYYTDEITFRKTLAYLNTFLPENEFRKLKDKRFRLRITGGININKKYKEELKFLLQ